MLIKNYCFNNGKWFHKYIDKKGKVLLTSSTKYAIKQMKKDLEYFRSVHDMETVYRIKHYIRNL
jgi:hypothetical protein